MLDALKNQLQQYQDKNDKYNYLREYLQLLILKILDEKGYFRNLAFVGGTALRILYDLKRFSEDLDFCLINKTRYSFKTMIDALTQELNHANLPVTANAKDHKVVAYAALRFDQVLFELGLSAHQDQKLSIKIEIDEEPAINYQTELTLINKEFLININHYDLPSLYAGKLHALLYRPYAKGRDYYDLLWYLSRKVEPNFGLLNQTILQTQKENPHLNPKKLTTVLREHLNKTDFKKISKDVAPFLLDAKELRYFNREFFAGLIK
jgi:predicted nucleotidyltransferase component of viral defense system